MSSFIRQFVTLSFLEYFLGSIIEPPLTFDPWLTWSRLRTRQRTCILNNLVYPVLVSPQTFCERVLLIETPVLS